ncbi:MAG: L-lactate dehydrogenase [Bacilli bacterium]|jgi:L-lactate dehydrogenase
MNNKIVIVGCGNVGMSYAYTLINQRTKVTDLILIDINQDKTRGEAMDLNHGLAFAPSKIKIRVGDYNDCADAQIVCLCAGANQAPGESRLDLVQKNYDIFKGIVQSVVNSGFKGLFLIATNPVDIMTYFTFKISGFPSSKVIGTGTTLDTARLRFLISERLKINSKNIHGYILGEHGDSEFPSWSNSSVGAVEIPRFLSRGELDIMTDKVRSAAQEIIKAKGATYYGIGMVLARLTNAILDDENSIFTVSSYNQNSDLYIGYPTIIGKSGVVGYVPLTLNDEEKKAFDNSARIIKETIGKVNQE